MIVHVIMVVKVIITMRHFTKVAIHGTFIGFLKDKFSNVFFDVKYYSSECNLGKWECTNNECPGICSVWGDSHFQTFDSRFFDFQGACEYILSKGTLTSYESFVTSIEVSCIFF